MTLDNDITLQQFREEMQHRVVKFPLNSRPVKDAMRFARQHTDPAFYRVAADKVHAQRQFRRELYGPSRWERVVDFVSLGSLREVILTLMLVGGGVASLETGRYLLHADPDAALYANMDVDELATRLGIALEQQTEQTERDGQGGEAVGPAADGGPKVTAPPKTTATKSALSDADVARIADAVIQRLATPKPDAANRVSTTTQESEELAANDAAPSQPAPTANAN